MKSKQNLRRKLAARPSWEKLEMLEMLRERSLTLRGIKSIFKQIGSYFPNPLHFS